MNNNETVVHAKHINHSLLTRNDKRNIRVFTTSVLRCSKDSELTGYLIEIDWEENSIKKQIPIPLDTIHPFWNSRGGNRGGRGLVYHKGVLYVDTATAILMYDDSLNKIGTLTHPHLSGLHEIFIENDGIWATSTLHDLILKIDFNGQLLEEWYGSKNEILQKEFNFSNRTLNMNLDFPADNFASHYNNYSRDEIFHLNSVFPHDDSVYVLSCTQKAFIRIKPEVKVIIKDKDLKSPHNGLIATNNEVLINDTRNQCLRAYNLETGERLRTVSTHIFGTAERPIQFANHGWQRGLFPVTHPVYLVGTSPATIFEVDVHRGLIGQICRIDTDVRHCIHGLTVVKE